MHSSPGQKPEGNLMSVGWLFSVVDMRMIVLLLSGGVVMVTGAGG